MDGATTHRRRHVAVVLVAALSMLSTAAVAASIAAPRSASTARAAPATSALVPVGPIRLADTRRDRCGCTVLDARTVRIAVADRPGVPAGAVAAAVTVTAVRTPDIGFVTVWPSGGPRPDVSTSNTRPDRIVANSAIVPIGADGSIDVFRSMAGHVVVDLTAVFVPAERVRAGRYRPVAARRIADTRTSAAPTGRLAPGGSLRIPLPADVDRDATALVVNITSVRAGAGHLSVRPAGSRPAATSILNPDGSGAPVAASTIVPVDEGGFVVDAPAGGHLVVDLLGWFTGPGAPERTDGLFVPVPPRRLLDSRRDGKRIHAGGGVELAVPFGGTTAAVVTNVTAVRPDHRAYVTAHAAGRPVPDTSTVNPASWNHTVANFAITRVGARGLAYRSSGGTDLIVDATGWFTGTPAVGSEPPPDNVQRRARVLLVGDSTLAALAAFPAAQAAFVGFDGVVDAESCRRLVRPSCRSDVTGRVPNTAVEAIAGAGGPVDVVVVKTGYNDWFSDFPVEFDAVVRAARAQGAHTVLWLTYNERVDRSTARRAYTENNVDLRHLVELPQYDDVLLADWYAYSDTRQDWFWDGTHLTGPGTWAIADYVSRWIAAIEHRPCPRPWTPGGPIGDPCPPPDRVGAVPDPAALYP